MPISNVFTKLRSNIQKWLIESASDIVEQGIKRNLDGGKYPKGDPTRGTTSIQDAISIEPVQDDGSGKMFIEIKIDLTKAPYAMAYEKGSGIHKEGGAEYPIPKEPGYVAFPKERWLQYEPPPEAPNIFVFPQGIMHPGVEAKPYIAPALRDWKVRGLQALGKAIKLGLMEEPRITIIEVKG